MKKKFLVKLGARIREIRREKSITQKELAEAIGTYQTTIPRIEKGLHSPNIYLLKEICTALKVELEDLLKGL